MTSQEASVRVRFEFSAADMADVARRSAERSKTIRDSRWQGVASWSTLLGLALFFALSGSFIARATFSVAFGLALCLSVPARRDGFCGEAHPSRKWSSPSATYLKYYREQLGGDGPFLCEVEITVVEEIVDTPDGLEFRCRIGGMLVVRDRAFDAAEMRSAFLRRAKEFLASGAGGS